MEQNVAQRLLAKQMSDISERCWAAGWHMETQYVLWQAVVEGPRKWGQDEISADDIAALQHLCELASGWIYNLAGDELFVPQDKWEKVYAIWAKTQRRQSRPQP